MADRILKNKPFKMLKRKLVNIIDGVRAIGSSNDLCKLGKIYRSDKIREHSYTPHYSSHFERFKSKEINILEIGVGGYEDPYKGGKSLRMWKKYFPLGKIFSIDIYDKSPHQENRIKIFKGSQVNENFLDEVTEEIGEIDIIIDDGSHINEHVIDTFKHLFPKLNDGGIYVVEDTQTSYWKDYGGDSEDLNNSKTIMNFFKRLTDGLNNKEFIKSNYKQSYFDKKIISMHFYHNLILIYKGNNNEESNILVNNKI
jgi:demethylmacrocin O-methyltransferase